MKLLVMQLSEEEVNYKRNCCNCFLWTLRDSSHVYLRCFVPCGWIYECSEQWGLGSVNLRQTFKVHNQKVSLQCAVTATQTEGPMYSFKVFYQSSVSVTLFGAFLEHCGGRKNV
jgi:hypothetical protein